MKKNFISIFILIIGINAFASGSIETMILRHPLVKSFDYDGSNNRGGSFKLQLKNGHEIYFQGVKSDLTFNTWSAIRYVNDITFSTVRYEFAGKSGDYGCLFLRAVSFPFPLLLHITVAVGCWRKAGAAFKDF